MYKIMNAENKGEREEEEEDEEEDIIGIAPPHLLHIPFTARIRLMRITQQ